MAARFWRALLALEALISAATAVLFGSIAHLSAAQTLLFACGAFLVLQFLWIALAWLFAVCTAPRALRLRDVHHLLRALVLEPLYFALAKFAMCAELRAQVVGTQAGAGARPVLLIHGILCNGAVWRPLRARLEAAGFAPVHAVNLEPLHADIEAYRASAEAELRALHRQAHGTPVAVVAHSMGGLVARALLRSGAAGLIRDIVTIATPHHGSTLARCLSLPAARQMRNESTWLRELNAAQEAKLPSPTVTISSPEDALIAPTSSARLGGAEAREMRGLGHFGLLRARVALDTIVEALART